MPAGVGAGPSDYRVRSGTRAEHERSQENNEPSLRELRGFVLARLRQQACHGVLWQGFQSQKKVRALIAPLGWLALGVGGLEQTLPSKQVMLLRARLVRSRATWEVCLGRVVAMNCERGVEPVGQSQWRIRMSLQLMMLGCQRI